MEKLVIKDWKLNRNELNELVLSPIFVSDKNTLKTLFRVKPNVKTTSKMTIVGAPSYFMQAATCNPTPLGSLALKAREIGVERLMIFMQQCWSEVFDTCMEADLRAGGNAMFDPNATPSAATLQAAMAEQIKNGISNDLWKIACFAQYDTGVKDGFYDRKHKGLFKNCDDDAASNLLANVNASSGSALSAGESVTIMQAMWDARPLALKGFDVGQLEMHVTDSMAENYRKYLQALGTEGANERIINGIPVLYWNGVPIISHPDWDQEFTEVFGEAHQHRALLTITGNAQVATDLADVDAALRMYSDVHEINWYTQGMLSFGGGKLALPELAVYAS